MIFNEWVWKVRVDDIIVFFNGEKINFIMMEQYIVSVNLILLSGVIVIGVQCFQFVFLLEFIIEVKIIMEQVVFIEKVWLIIEEVNCIVLVYVRVDKFFVFFIEFVRLFVCVGKGIL